VRVVGMVLLGRGITLLVPSGIALLQAEGPGQVIGFLICTAFVPVPMVVSGTISGLNGPAQSTGCLRFARGSWPRERCAGIVSSRGPRPMCGDRGARRLPYRRPAGSPEPPGWFLPDAPAQQTACTVNRGPVFDRAASRVIERDSDQDGKLHFLVMEYTDGPSLQEVVKQHGPLPWALAADYVRQAALGLQHAHPLTISGNRGNPGNARCAENKLENCFPAPVPTVPSFSRGVRVSADRGKGGASKPPGQALQAPAVLQLRGAA
jgi:hypothetical protein